MKLNRYLFATPIVAAGIYFVSTAQFRAISPLPPDVPPPPPYTATITDDTIGVIADKVTQTDRIALQPAEIVQITVQFPMSQVGDTVTLDALDGGCMLDGDGNCVNPNPNQQNPCSDCPVFLAPPPNQLTVANDGTVSLYFMVGQDPGACQVSMKDGDADVMALQLWVLDPDDAGNAPACANIPAISDGEGGNDYDGS